MDFAAAAQSVLDNVATVIDGKQHAIETALVVMLAEGHLLIEDVPGVGKTALARALARSVDCSVRRIQFTPDLLPSDVTGVSVFNQAVSEFEFKPGSVFANIVIGDEINRASPKTQSALLEAMEERQVSVDGTTYPLPAPFMVVATQNPFEMEGTYLLPEAQRDRFMARISLGYPDADAELAMLRDRDLSDPAALLQPVVMADDLQQMIIHVRAVHVAESVERYIVALARATRESGDLRLGASPRATLQLVRAAKALAALRDREFVLPDDVAELAPLVLAHRLVPLRGGGSTDEVVADVLRRVPV
ncbi:AAA domain-containing protein [Aeromicrobium sp. 636]|uniref:AAA family ATPase n=1 Tax=Aeromicrobium senzhongii TaxID=2663859 RepID=A0A8I0ESI7_9ACTN|nr:MULTISPECIES: AAA family ATPase [Aeromicrobium]MBC9225631.1 AAA family ATPase [Aeromicrobium senzhongii]MCQ3997740.1 AAA domain-containing protein [Aeromicrobium sp. 636]MTB87667.1 AAA domain-containing protein [Aeromicrobium senzhongii]QNL95301.1 AAA family ATPase [Aeromicrobium senzhongii]